MIVDDEELARSLLRQLLPSDEGNEIVADCANGFEAVRAYSEHKPDLIFLDVQMPKLDGFEVIELIGPDPAVVFVTAYDTYAMRAFEVYAVDYLLKPVSQERVVASVARARQRLQKEIATPAPNLSSAARAPGAYLERVVVKDGAKVHVLPVSRIDYIEAQDDYVAIWMQGKSYLKQQTLSGLEEGLDPSRFIRIHRSCLVNLEKVVRVEPYSKDSRVAILADGTNLPVSQNGMSRLSRLL
jgi:two-component system LytT family response regulator